MSARVSRRVRVLVALPLVLAGVWLAWVGSPLGAGSRVVAVPVEEVVAASMPPVERVQTRDDEGGPRSALVPGATQPGREEFEAAGPAPSRERVRDEEMWELVDRLRALAANPLTFHARALPLVNRLGRLAAISQERDAHSFGRAGGDGPGAGVQGSKERTQVAGLLELVVRSRQESDLVRGAVLLALATVLDPEDFRSVFRAWLEGPASSAELRRSAALAAAQRGSTSPCVYPLDLERLARLPFEGAVEAPPYYELRLDRIVGPYEAELLRTWLMARDPRAERFTLAAAAGAQADPTELEALAEFFVTSEILFAVWGHRGLIDEQIRDVVRHEALLDASHKWSPSLIHFRVASFLVHSLAPCDDGLRAAAEHMASSGEPFLTSMAGQMAKLGSRGLNSDQIARIEELRYSTDPREEIQLMRLLMAAGEGLEDLSQLDPRACEDACLYLNEIVQDPSVTEGPRAGALTAIAGSGQADLVFESASSALRGRGPDTLAALALASLNELVRVDGEWRVPVLEVLREVRPGENRAWILADLDRFIAEYSR
jgi:hypothetical protein